MGYFKNLLNKLMRRSLPGDVSPANFDVHASFTVSEILELIKRNVVIKIATKWKVDEMFKAGLIFEDDSFDGTIDIGNMTLPLKTFTEYMELTSTLSEIQLGCVWAIAFGDAIVVIFDGLIRAYHPYADNVGFKLNSDDPDNMKYIVYTYGGPTEGIPYTSDQVIQFSAPRLSEVWGGDSMILDILPYARAFELLSNSLALRGAKMGVGLLIFESDGEITTEVYKALEKINSQNINDLSNLILPDGLKSKYLTPTITGNIVDMFELLFKIIAMALRISRSQFTGDDAGAIASARYSTLYSRGTIEFLQKHFKVPMMQVFYALGNTDPRFEFVNPYEGLEKVEVKKPFQISEGMTENDVKGEDEAVEKTETETKSNTNSAYLENYD